MRQVIKTKFGEAIVEDIMIAVDKKTLEEGVKIKCSEINFLILISGVEAEDFDEIQVEEIIKENS